MPKYTINRGTEAEKTIEAEFYKTDPDWVRFFNTRVDGNLRECASYPRISVVSVEEDGKVS